MKVYLDTCSLQRPLDSKDQARNVLEAEAVLLIISLCETESVEMVSSDALLFEIRRISNPARREFALEMLVKAKLFVKADEAVQDRAREIIAHGVMPLDALHLASAEEAEADFFCTCDDKLLKKARMICEPQMRVMTPIQLLEEMEE
jgi:predicted nucleic acid-binding protein